MGDVEARGKTVRIRGVEIEGIGVGEAPQERQYPPSISVQVGFIAWNGNKAWPPVGQSYPGCGSPGYRGSPAGLCLASPISGLALFFVAETIRFPLFPGAFPLENGKGEVWTVLSSEKPSYRHKKIASN